ncbi:TPA: alanine--tRNA ligase [Candidatus Dependentiae bacterium]|nr:MAG: Alanyl-tRNA ligase [candidate division TM6 bacterium GW2011_GWF2_43_87]HBL98261.1 alanine--tRNA ligase [Candidatus Dependentiae bacterium]
MKSIEIRQKFFEFFKKNGHTHVASSSLIPADDPTLLFANAGMNQFKDIFLGKEKRHYSRAVTIQKCMRAGGKHNDLDNVGRTARHLTFFEMLGNFSFGDYFKQDAIRFAWDFLTKELNLSPDKLYISVYEADDEAYQIWNKEIGIPADHIVRLGRRDNFWQMGDTGPCGPCSEIYYDRGPKDESEVNLKVGDECERFLEIWNLVFMQFDRQADGKELPLERKGIDTGMGLERISAVLQNASTVLDTDLFEPLMTALEKFSGRSYKSSDAETQTAFRVLADHIRSTSLCIADGGMPSNEGRGYVLRKIIRRAALFAQKLGDLMFFARLAPVLIENMGPIYPELYTSRELIISIITSELEKFSHNLIQGQGILQKYLKDSTETKVISGEQAFKLYDTYGFPFELTSLVAYEQGFTVDEPGFEKAMSLQREQSGKKVETVEKIVLDPTIVTEFVGYNELVVHSSIIALMLDGQFIKSVERGTECIVITKQSPFYIAGGGQMEDTGYLSTSHGNSSLIKNIKKVSNAYLLTIDAPEKLVLGDKVTLTVDKKNRKSSARNHTATHLLQSALMKLVGSHVKQAGSLVSADYLRFDFTHHDTLSSSKLMEIEELVNQKILENLPVNVRTTNYKQALEDGVIAFFGEKYNPESVRVVEVTGFSSELCGGTHVQATGEIGLFKITSSAALSTGVKRITAVTGDAARELFDETLTTVKTLSQHFKVQTHEVVDAVNRLQNEQKELTQALREIRQKLASLQIPEWLNNSELVRGMPFGFIVAEEMSGKELRELGQILVQKKPGFYFLLSHGESSSTFFALRAAAFANAFDLRACAAWLTTKGLKGGCSGDTMQGGAVQIPQTLKNDLRLWLESNMKA